MQTTQGSAPQTAGNQKEISGAKNLLKESLLSADFPQDLLDRWSAFQNAGLENKIETEREIFKKLFIRHGKSVFEFCGRVLHFVEQVGHGKAGSSEKVHRPIHWIENYWETNLSRYTAWQSQLNALEEAQVRKLEKKAQKKAQKAEKMHLEALEEKNNREWIEQMNKE